MQIAARWQEVIRKNPSADRSGYLQMIARQGGDDALADVIAAHDADRRWSVPWAHWRSAAGYQTGPLYPELNTFALMPLSSGPCVIASCRDKLLRIWDLESGEQSGEPITGLHGSIWSLAVGHMNGKPIAVTGAGSSDAAVQTWDLESRTQIGAPLIGHTDFIHSLAVIEIGGRSIAVSGSSDHTVRVWDLAEHKQIGEPFLEHNGTVYALAVATVAGRPVVISSTDEQVKVWDLESRQPVGGLFRGHESGIRRLVVAEAHGRPVVAAATRHTLHVWDLDTGELIFGPVTHDDSYTDLPDYITGVNLFSEDGRLTILTCGNVGIARMWRLGDGEPVATFHSRYRRVVGLDSMVLGGLPVALLGHEDGSFLLLPLMSNGSSAVSGRKTYWTDAVAVTESKGQRVAISTGPDGAMRLWNLSDGALVNEAIECGDEYLVSIVLVELDGRPAAIINGYEKLQVWWLDTYAKNDLELTFDSPVLALAATTFQGAPLLVSGHKDGRIRCTRLDGKRVGAPLLAFTYKFSSTWTKNFEVNFIAATELAGAPIAFNYAGAVQAWNLEEGKKLWQYMPDSYSLTLISLGDDVLAASGGDGDIRIWHLATGKEFGKPLVAHQGIVTALLGTEFFGVPTLISGGNDGTVRIWDVASRAARVTIDVGSPVYALAADSAGHLVIGQRIGLTAIRFNRSPHDDGGDDADKSQQVLTASDDDEEEKGYIEQLAEQMLPILAPDVFTHGTAGFSLFPKKPKKQRPKSKAEATRWVRAATIVQRAAWHDGSLYEEAIRCFGEALRVEPDDVSALQGRGAALRMRGRYDQALADLTRALDLDPDHSTTRTERAITLRGLGRYDESADDLSRVLAKDPSSFFARRARGVTYRRAGRYEEALADLERAAKADPADVLTRQERGETYRMLYRYDDASVDLGEALKADTDDLFCLRARGSVHRSLGRFEDALADFTRALDLEHPQTLFSLCGKADTLAAMGRADDAEEVLQAALRAYPQSAYLQDRYGSFLSTQGRYGEAHRVFDTAVSMAGGSSAAYLAHKVEVFMREGLYADAVQLGEQAVAADPQCRDALSNLGDALICVGQPGASMEYLDRAIKIRAGREPLVLKGVICWHQGDRDTARDVFTRATQVADDCTLFRLAELMAIALTGTGQPEQGVQAVRAAIGWRLPGDIFRPAPYNLLENPHMIGIEGVRRVIEHGWEN
jgi:WD40 repeat protein/tetratricopeptide (TPR) repeat protein